MKSFRTLRRLLAVCTFSLLSVTAAVQAFEGKVSMTMTGSRDQTLPITYYIKGTHMRAELSATDKKGNQMNMTMLTDWDARQMTIVMNEQKMYMVHSIPQVDTQKNTHDISDFKPTGRKEKIAGYESEEFVGTSEGKRVEMWVTKGMGDFMMANMNKGRGAAQSSQWEAFMHQGGYFPMRVIQRDKEGSPEKMHMEVTSVEKASQPDSLFTPPADFRKLEMPDMGAALKGLIPGAR